MRVFRFPPWFFAHSESIAKWAFMTATLLIGTKNFVASWLETGGISSDLVFSLAGMMDIIATCFFFVSSWLYGEARKDRDKVRPGGLCAMVAATCLIIGGWRGSFADISFWLHVAGMLPTVWAGYFLWKGQWLVAATPELMARIPYAIGGFMQGDYGQVLSCAVAAIGDLGLIATGLKLKDASKAQPAP